MFSVVITYKSGNQIAFRCTTITCTDTGGTLSKINWEGAETPVFSLEEDKWIPLQFLSVGISEIESVISWEL